VVRIVIDAWGHVARLGVDLLPLWSTKQARRLIPFPCWYRV